MSQICDVRVWIFFRRDGASSKWPPDVVSHLGWRMSPACYWQGHVRRLPKGNTGRLGGRKAAVHIPRLLLCRMHAERPVPVDDDGEEAYLPVQWGHHPPGRPSQTSILHTQAGIRSFFYFLHSFGHSLVSLFVHWPNSLKTENQACQDSM